MKLEQLQFMTQPQLRRHISELIKRPTEDKLSVVLSLGITTKRSHPELPYAVGVAYSISMGSDAVRVSAFDSKERRFTIPPYEVESRIESILRPLKVRFGVRLAHVEIIPECPDQMWLIAALVCRDIQGLPT